MGDLARILGRADAFPETETVARVPDEHSPAMEKHYDPARFPHYGVKETETCFTLNPAASGKLILFRDSFAGSWTSFLCQNFREVVYIWQYEWNLPLLEREKPDIVVDEILERFLSVSDPVDLARRDQASLTNTVSIPASSAPPAGPR